MFACINFTSPWPTTQICYQKWQITYVSSKIIVYFYSSNFESMKVLLTCLLVVTLVHTSYSATYTVINTNPNGAGSLLLAIDQANENPGLDNIVFDIPGPAPHVISLASTASIMITDELILDGSTQPGNGYTGTCPKIVLDASAVETSVSILILLAAAQNTTIQGLWIRNFTNPNSTALFVSGSFATIGAPDRKNIFTNVFSSIGISGNDVLINSNYFGCDCEGNMLLANAGDAIYSYTPVDNLTIVDNLISGNANGIQIGTSGAPTTNLIITGNKIGTDIHGNVSLGNTTYGINLINVTGLQLGGTGDPLTGNVLSGNGRSGCLLTACSGTVYGNKIGTDITGHYPLPNDPQNTEYNSAFNCNGYTGISGSLVVGGTSPGQQNIIYGGDIGLNIADYSGHYEIINNLIGQTQSGIVSDEQYYGIQLVYDTTHIRLDSNYIYGTNAAFYAYECKNFEATDNIFGLDIHGNELSVVNGYSVQTADSFKIQQSIIRNCIQGIILRDCNSAYIAFNSIEECETPIVMTAGDTTCHHNQLFRNAIAFNDYPIQLNNGTPYAANDNIFPPVIEGSTQDSTWGSGLPFATIDLCYDTTLAPLNPQGYLYPIQPITADVQGHWVYTGYLERPDQLTAMQTDINNNSSAFADPLIVGISALTEVLISVHPNPAVDFITIQYPDGIKNHKWQIVNMQGAVLAKGNLTNDHSNQIYIGQLSQGPYLFTVTSINKTCSVQFLKI